MSYGMQFNFSPNPAEVVLAVFLSAFFGGLIGVEREVRHKPAGLKTHALVSLGACCFTLIGVSMLRADSPDGVAGDPMKLISGVITGVGFLGAGTIMQQRRKVRGLTTAATIWLAAAVGIASGAGYHLLLGAMLAAAFLVLLVVRWVEHRAIRDADHPGASIEDDAEDDPWNQLQEKQANRKRRADSEPRAERHTADSEKDSVDRDSL